MNGTQVQSLLHKLTFYTQETILATSRHIYSIITAHRFTQQGFD